MLINRIIGAFTFRKGVYADVEHDPSFTTTAWMIVVIATLLNRLNALLYSSERLFAAIVSAILSILGFAIGVLVINWIGSTLFKANVTFGQGIRALGLAYVWKAIGILSLLASFSTPLSGVLDLLIGLATIISWLIAAKEALDLDWLKTGITVVLGWLVQFVITTVGGGLTLGLFELVVGALS